MLETLLHWYLINMCSIKRLYKIFNFDNTFVNFNQYTSKLAHQWADSSLCLIT